MTEINGNTDLNHTQGSNGFLNKSFENADLDIPVIKVSDASTVEDINEKQNGETLKETEINNHAVEDSRVDIRPHHQNNGAQTDRGEGESVVGSISFEDDFDMPKYTPRFRSKKGALIGSENLITDGVGIPIEERPIS